MIIEHSADFGQTWETLKVFTHNCSAEFDLEDNLDEPCSLCTSRYSGTWPCSGGEVILRTLDPSNIKSLDPYSPEALVRLTITNLRIRLLKAQAGPTSLTPTATPQSPPSAPFAVYTLQTRGTSLCHKHAEYCLPSNGCLNKAQNSNMVFGKCLCLHHTEGDHCEKCAHLYNDLPWRPANGSSDESNPCQRK